MGMTMTEKILARAAGKSRLAAGETAWVEADVLMTHDVCGPGTIAIFQREFGRDARVWDKTKVVIIPDHYIFTKDVHARRNIEILREFVKEQGIEHFYDVGTEKYKGVCHVALPEEGHTRPGEVLFGTDSHTCTAGAFNQFATGIGNTDAGFLMGTGKLWVRVPPTLRFVFKGRLPEYLMAKDMILAVIGAIGVDGATYAAMEFAGEGVLSLNIEERMTLCNMVIEAGGKNGVIECDSVCEAFVKSKTSKPFTPAANDPDARFQSEMVFDCAQLEPMVALPHSPDNKATVGELKGHKIDRAYIGSCTGGKTTDFRAAARILKGRATAVDTFIVPATTEVAKALETERINGATLKQIFIDAGCKIGEASCAACLGGPADTFGRVNDPIRCISTTNRNFPGRMGSKQAGVYLASPLTVAASAVRGEVADPRDLLS
ncbi:MAG: 2,3-dimethylmalate dehydratase large subunit [candidate division BRC1 bacterium ADurb.BinA364]|nr:MAG: 2,3-dimethylmalate dehydratase large subunit [candidate division BRC1 bacterium ADurb.BinA364]